MQYYRSTATGKIMCGNFLNVLNDVFGEDTLANMTSDGLLVAIENPSVIDCIRSGNMSSAFTRYREIHECSMADAKKAVYTIRADISRTQSIDKRKKKKSETKGAK